MRLLTVSSVMLLVVACAADPRPPKEPFAKPSESTLRQRLTATQFDVTQRGETEPPFANAYWDLHAEGIYVDVVSGEPLFSSLDKFDSNTGWPSFTRPLEAENVTAKHAQDAGPIEVPDADGGSHIVHLADEVRSAAADSHLGHVFDDGPPPLGLRYCINSAALRFIPKSELAQAGYGRYLPLFEKKATSR